MLLELFRWLGEDIRAFQVFNYLSLRAVLAALTALAIGFMAGPATIRYLREMKMGENSYCQRRHADDGRRADFDCHRFINPVVDGSEQPLCLGGSFRDVGIRLDRLGR